MGFTTWANAIRTYFDSAWSSNGDGTVVIYENLKYEPTKGTPYLVVGVRLIDATWETPSWVEAIGQIVVAAMVPEGRGPEAGETLAELVAAQFRDKATSGVTFEEPTIDHVGPNEKGFYQINVRVPWSYYEASH